MRYKLIVQNGHILTALLLQKNNDLIDVDIKTTLSLIPK